MENTNFIVPIALPVIGEPISAAEVAELACKIKASYQTAAAHVLTTGSSATRDSRDGDRGDCLCCFERRR